MKHKNLKEMINEMINKEFLIESAVNYTKILKTLTIKDISKVPKDGKFHDMGARDIIPSELGPFAPAIESMTVKVKGGWYADGSSAIIELEYKYKHPSGSNGYSVRLYTEDAGKTWSTTNPKNR